MFLKSIHSFVPGLLVHEIFKQSVGRNNIAPNVISHRSLLIVTMVEIDGVVLVACGIRRNTLRYCALP